MEAEENRTSHRTERDEPTVVTLEPFNAEASPAALSAELTPDGAHFGRSHFASPRIAPALHRLEVAGAVAQPASWDLNALRSLGERTVTVTLECAGNGRLD